MWSCFLSPVHVSWGRNFCRMDVFNCELFGGFDLFLAFVLIFRLENMSISNLFKCLFGKIIR